MRVPNWVADTIVETPSDELFYIDTVDDMWPEEDGLFRDPVYDEYIYSRCGAQLSDDEIKLYHQITLNYSNRTKSENTVLNLLYEKRASFSRCHLKAQFDAIFSSKSD
jgi:hypothetical protein